MSYQKCRYNPAGLWRREHQTRENHADMILAVGGGSTMDCCKAVSLQAKYDGDVWKDFWAHQGVIDFEPKKYGKSNAQIILRWHIQDGNL